MSNKAGSSSSTRARLLNPAPEELRQLVLDYLVHNCYTSAARVFVGESSGPKDVDADGDEVMASPVKEASNELDEFEERLAMSELRKDIRTRILTGNIEEATALLNKHFPAVLSENMEADGAPPSPSVPSGRFSYLPSTSVDPTHLALNLHIQAFIEAARTIPLEYIPPGASTPLPHPPLLSGASDKKHSTPGDEDAAMSEFDNEDANAALLIRAQNLYSEANQLSRPQDRATYLHELGQVGGVLAYTVPERSPLATYMTQTRRDGVANQIDSAILYRAKRPIISRIELYARYTATLWGMLHDRDVKIPPRSTWPANVALPPMAALAQESKIVPSKDTGSLDSAIPSVKKTAQEKEPEEILPPFDLHLFVQSTERVS
ncbi:hypothetical protein BD310DRAFT_28239 [Dichomitus squalens]|uniref:CTLH/CRA C-terminal to LisH motif domain-containing protein n=1 Tax=Dichomitus squalens TaxID=114155 RepID=A0A4V2K9Z7_9APHY|nr:hypothetical protein BD310DRAFT_28239 [Dichomitus squalens]